MARFGLRSLFLLTAMLAVAIAFAVQPRNIGVGTYAPADWKRGLLFYVPYFLIIWAGLAYLFRAKK